MTLFGHKNWSKKVGNLSKNRALQLPKAMEPKMHKKKVFWYFRILAPSTNERKLKLVLRADVLKFDPEFWLSWEIEGYPTQRFGILELQNPSILGFEQSKNISLVAFEALKSWNVRSGVVLVSAQLTFSHFHTLKCFLCSSETSLLILKI